MTRTSETRQEAAENQDFVSNQPAEKPSTMFHGDLYVVRLYTDESIDGHVYNHVKHIWYKNSGSTMCICHYYDDGTYRFVMWQTKDVRWYQVWPERFEAKADNLT